MKKLSKSLLVFASAAMILANGFFVSCSNGDDGDSTPTVTTPKPGADNGNNGGNQNGNGSGNNNGNQNGNDNQNNGGNQNGNDNQNNGGNGNGNGNGGNNGGTSFTAPDLSTYYKKYFVTTDSAAPNFGKSTDTWGSGSGCEPNSDGTLKLTSAHMWDAAATEGVVAAYNDLTAGVLASYEYIVFTVDTSSFTSTFTSASNDGVNVKLAQAGGGDKLLTISNNSVKGENNTVTYYAKISDFDSVPQTANQLALIIGGSGTLVVKEIYAAATSDPALKPVTGITITPTTANVDKNGTLQLTVKDSNFADVTSAATYTVDGEAKAGSSVNAGLLTAGTTSGTLTVTAKYTANGQEFTATATITVLKDLTNLLTTINTDSAKNQVTVTDNGNGSFTLTSNGAGGEWGQQVFFTVDSTCLAKLVDGAKIKINAKVTTETAVRPFMKLQVNNGYAGIDIGTAPSIAAGETKEISLEGTLSGVVSNEVVLLIDFRGTESGKAITISDFKIFDLNE